MNGHRAKELAEEILPYGTGCENYYALNQNGIDRKNLELNLLFSRLVEMPSETNLWTLFEYVQGCKPEKEDCDFQSCQRWATCKGLIESFINLLKGEKT